ncbi:MAG: hypothetical protein V4594_09760 [Bacteroidota bacterium]
MNSNALLKPIFLVPLLFLLIIQACNVSNKTSTDPVEVGRQREQASAERNNDTLGKYIDIIDFEVNTSNPEYKDGVIPWVSIANPEAEIAQLKNADEIVISQKTVSIVIDYPLTNEYHIDVESSTGFTRAQLLKEISKAYHKIYEEEEASATIKTIPIEKRTTSYNRNDTNGKYGIWGHDIVDLTLTHIEIYETPAKKLILALITES